jgi:elongation factor Ts
MEITAKMVKDLREATGAGPLDCKKALESNNGDVQKAVDFLREKGLAKAAKKLSSDRVMNEGVIQTYSHHNKRLGVIVEVNCETDFVANTDQFQQFARDVALQIANLAPQYVRREDVPESVIQEERNIQLRRTLDEGKPQNVAEKIVDGRMNKFFEEICLLEQPFIKDDSKTISQLRCR